MTLNPFRIYRSYIFIERERHKFFKLMSVVLSCETWHQCNTACNYVMLMHHRYTESQMSVAYKALFADIFNHVIMYLQDTAYHAENKYHYSQMLNQEKITRWPNINDYLKDAMPTTRFHMVWERGRDMMIDAED